MHKLPIAAALAAIACAIAMAMPRGNWDEQARQRKAEYLYFEGQNAYCDEDYAAYVAMTRRAYELDSTDLDIASEWGLVTLGDASSDSAAQQNAYAHLRTRYFTNPSDYLTGRIVASLAIKYNNFADALDVWQMLDSLYPANAQPAQEMARCQLMMYLNGDSAAFDKAIAIYDRLETGSGKTVQLSAQKIRAYALKQDTAAIVSEVEGLVAHAPKDSYAAYFAGINYEVLNDMDQALKYFSRACDLDSAYGEAYMAKARIYSEMGDSSAYDREVFKALKSTSLEVEPKLQILRTYVQGLYDDPAQEPRIRSLFEDLEQMHAGEADIHTLYASYLYAIDDYPGAAEQMTYSVALNPADEGVWISLVQALDAAGDTTGVNTYSRQAFEKFPDNLYFPIIVANRLMNADGASRAVEYLDSIKIGNINNPSAVSNFISFKGDLYAQVGDTALALQAYDQAIEIFPDNFLALNNAAYFMAQSGIDLDKAEQYSARVVRNVPDNPTYLDTYAWIFFKKKDYSMARNYIDMTLNLYNSLETESKEGGDGEDGEDGSAISADVLEHAGDIYFMNGEPDKAIDYWKQALKLDPDNELLARKVKHKTYFYK